MKKKEALKKGYVFCGRHWHANAESARTCGMILRGAKKEPPRPGRWLFLTEKPRRAPGCFEKGKRR